VWPLYEKKRTQWAKQSVSIIPNQRPKDPARLQPPDPIFPLLPLLLSFIPSPSFSPNHSLANQETGSRC
jgi:hypothetical protein